MENLSLVFVAALSLSAVGCKKGGGDCDKAISHSMELAKADMAKMGVDDKTMAKMADIGAKNCKEDKWSAEAVSCMAAAKTEAEAQTCYGKLSADQMAKMNKAAQEIQPTPTAPAGSDMAAPNVPAPSSSGSDAKARGDGEMAGSAAMAGSGSAAMGSAK